MAVWEEEGQALVLLACLFPIFLGFLGMSVDVGLLFRARRQVQIAADAGAVAAALDMKYNASSSSAIAAGKAATSANGVTDGSNGATVTVNTPPSSGPNTSCGGCVEVIASEPTHMIFISYFTAHSPTVSARAVAGHGTTENCVYLLGTSGADFNNSGAATLTLNHCGFIDDSKSSNAFTNSGSLTMSALSIGVVGGSSNSGAWNLSPKLTTGIAGAGYPLTRPVPSTAGCGAALSYPSSTTVTLSPGCYNGLSITGAANITLKPGLYVINGPVVLTGAATLQGTGVTLYFNSSIQFSGSIAMLLSAPTSGTWNGILFYEGPSDTSGVALTGAASSILQGIIFLPSAVLDISGAGSMQLWAAFVVSQLKNSGAASMTVQDYLQKNPNSPLARVVLME